MQGCWSVALESHRSSGTCGGVYVVVANSVGTGVTGGNCILGGCALLDNPNESCRSQVG